MDDVMVINLLVEKIIGNMYVCMYVLRTSYFVHIMYNVLREYIHMYVPLSILWCTKYEVPTYHLPPTHITDRDRVRKFFGIRTGC